MFVPYSSDHCIEFRPWLFFVFFPLIVAGAFVLIANERMPETALMQVIFFEISGFFVVVYMAGTCFALWTFGKAVCAKIGNILYLFSLLFSLAVGGMLLSLGESQSIWLFNWIVHCLAGFFIIYCPINSVDYFILFPPFRSFSMIGLWAVIVWLIYDFLFCLFLGWTFAAFLHPLSFLLGVLLGSLFLKIPYVGRDLGDITLWQWIRGENPDEELAWQDSWSVKRGQLHEEQQEIESREEFLKDREQDFVHQTGHDQTEDTFEILCQCGEIVQLSVTANGQLKECPHCHHQLHLPKM
jgi:hypothetical protein